MKTLLIMLLLVTLTSGVSAQRKGYYPVYHHVYRPRIYISPFSYGLGYGNPYYSYPFGYPYRYREMPYKLELQIESIKVDYKNRIRQARRDKTLNHAQRRQEIRNLKTERDEDIINARRDYSRRPPVTNNRNQLNNGQENL
jgi:hypothetical protein